MPAVLPVENYQLIALIEHDVAGLCGYVSVFCRQGKAERAHLFEAAVVVGGIADRAARKPFEKRVRRRVLLREYVCRYAVYGYANHIFFIVLLRIVRLVSSLGGQIALRIVIRGGICTLSARATAK